MIHVLIVEDDPMVASLIQRYVEALKGFHCMGIARHPSEARPLLIEHKIDLVLLDVHMPGQDGLSLLKELREQDHPVDVILVTAASETERIQQALRFGAIDYIIKPFAFERLHSALIRFQKQRNLLSDSKQSNQHQIDQLFQSSSSSIEVITVPKGLTKTTLDLVIELIRERENQRFTTDEIAEAAAVSRVSIRKYLKFLTAEGFLQEQLEYGVGRPVYHYSTTNKALQSELFSL